MVQLKQVSYRLKSIRNIQKITKTMKMVSASKFTKAERELKSARAFGYGPRKFYVSSHLQKGALDDEEKHDKKSKEESSPPQPTDYKTQSEEEKRKIRRIYIAMTSDREGSIVLISSWGDCIRFYNKLRESMQELPMYQKD